MKYRKKPLVIDAVKFNPPHEIPTDVRHDKLRVGFVGYYDREIMYESRYYIDTLEGAMEVRAGDWIITGVEGERYPCKPSIFEATYEKVT